MNRVLITGVAGFLGSHLAQSLLSEGNNIVIGVDNLSTGKIKNLEPIKDNSNFELIVADVAEKDIIEMEQLEGVEQIYHLASPASPKFYQAKPLDTIAANTVGLKNMLDIARKSGAKVLYASTSEAYGDPEVNPQPEEYRGNVNTWGPRACYDESKRLGEVFCYEYYKGYQVPVKVARIFNTYSAGLRNDDGRVIVNFVLQALEDKDITVYGDGTQTRSFCYVDDTVRALKLMMEKDEATGEIINVGNPQEYKIIELAYLIKELTGSKSNITFHQLPEDDPKVRHPSIKKATELLGWYPVITLKEGLIKTIEAYRGKEIQC